MKKLSAFVLCILAVCAVRVSAQTVYPFHDTSLSDDERVTNLLSLMTLDEKVNALGTNVGVKRLGIFATGHSEGLHGMALGGPGGWGEGTRMVNGRMVKNEFPTTIFPQSYGLGETWDVPLIRKVADIEATEVRWYTQNPTQGYGGMIMRAPNADLARDPRWGRTEESFGEDPWHTAAMTVAFAQGLQGPDPDYWKSASLMKHFMANSNEDLRTSTSSDFDERLMREYYSYPFYKGITEGGSRAFMASYNLWNGVPMTIHPMYWEIVRPEWGMNGIICTDAGAIRNLVESQDYFTSLPEAAAGAVKAGVGQLLDTYKPHIYKALEKGILTEAEIDRALRGNYIVALKLGLLDPDPTKTPYGNIGVTEQTDAPFESPEVRDFVRHVTAKSVVLLKNEAMGGAKLLPIDAAKIKTIAVIGPRANDVVLDWYSGTPPYVVSVLDGIQAAVGEDVEVIYAERDEAGAAVEAAKKADIALVCVGNYTDPRWLVSPVPSDGREAMDRKAISLEQEDLVKVVHKANPRTVMVLISSFPYAINWSKENLPAIVHLANNSQELGNGLADVLFGKFNPAGRLNQTWVTDITELPEMMDYDIRHGRTYMYYRGTPLYPFGYGLSYSDFAYSGLKLSAPSVAADGVVTVSFDVKNTSARDGEEVPQLYVSFPGSKVERPVRQLRGFTRTAIGAGETQRIEIELAAADLAYWDVASHAWVVEPGRVDIMVGSSSADIRLRGRLTVK
jgi:beta-glucosidase